MSIRILLRVLLAVFLLCHSLWLCAAIPGQERAVLIALYNSTQGDGWLDKTGWKTAPLHTDGFAKPGTENGWAGIKVTGDHVTIINLSHNNLNGPLPSELGNLTRLDGLFFSSQHNIEGGKSNYVKGNIPPELGNLKNLRYLYLDYNDLTGGIPGELGNLSQLEYLVLNNNQMTGSIPSPLGNLVNLTFLDLRSNTLTGSIPAALGNLKKLKLLNLSTNQLSGSIPVELENMSLLTDLDLSYNALGGSIPAQLGNLSQVESLYLHHNQLTGTIPTALGKLAKLRILDLFENQLTGSIPTQLGNLGELKYLLLQHNQLSGSIPTELGQLSNLNNLDLSQNQLGGSIPAELGNIRFLNEIKLYQNQLRGSIPAELGDNENLFHLDLNHNRLTGEIPSHLTHLTSIFMYADFGSNCLYATDPALRAWLSKVNPDWEAHQNECGGNIYMSVNRTYLNLSYVVGGPLPANQTVLIHNMGSGQLNWNASTSQSWLAIGPASGTGNGELQVSLSPAGLVAGNYSGFIHITAANAVNSPQTIGVTLSVYNPGETTAPFGEFATPLEGAEVSSSIPVTGWVLDDVGITSVKIYNGDAYVGDAALVEGARPDVEIAYPTYPDNNKAGWGYMLLTHFLPNGGNGTFTLVAKATDTEGNEVILGSRTIVVDNTTVHQPFGAIDTPFQGGTVKGKGYVNFGWALSPQPYSIATDGSTIDVVVDGVVLGHPVYNQYRADIATLFPGYANSNGAVGYFYLDTTQLRNGVHTIAWNVTSNIGFSDGIGSRYFTVLNLPTSSAAAMNEPSAVDTIGEPILNVADHVNLYGETDDAIQIKELQRLELNLCHEPNMKSAVSDENPATTNDSTKKFRGYQVVGDELRVLPIGSTLDQERGIFYWQPGPGFVGPYRFVFVRVDKSGQVTQRNVVVDITSK